MRTIRWLVAMAIVGLSASFVVAEDWPQLTGPHGDWTVNETGLANEWPKEGPKLLWESKEVGGGFSWPVVAGGKVFVISRPVDLTVKDKHGLVPRVDERKYLPGPDVLSCHDRNTGAILWKHEFNTLTNKDATAWNTPTVVNDLIYARGGDGQVRCISAKDGKTVWVWPKDGEAPYAKDELNVGIVKGAEAAGGIVVCDGIAIVLGSHKGYKSKYVGLDAKTGAKVWEQFQYQDALLGANNYTVHTVGKTKAFAAVGVLRDVHTGAQLCTYDIYGYDWCMTGKDDMLFSTFQRNKEFNHGGGIHRIRFEAAADGKISATQVWKWKSPITDEQAKIDHLYKSFAGPVLTGGALFVFEGYKGNGNMIECVDAATGKDLWPERIKLNHGYNSPICADGKIYYTDMNGTLGMFAADPKGYRPLGSAKVLDPSYSSPVISGGCLFAHGDAGGLKCYDLRVQK